MTATATGPVLSDELLARCGERAPGYAPVIVGIWPDPADNEANTKWVRDYYAAIHPHSGSGACILGPIEQRSTP